MPTGITYNNLEQLLEHIAENMTANGNQENTGARTQSLLLTIAQSLLAIVGDAPDAVGFIPEWDPGLEYTDQTIVEHNGFLWLYAGGGPNTGTEPGTNSAVWFTLGQPPAPNLAQVLAVGNRSGAKDIDVDAGQAIAFRGPESDGRIRLVPTAVTDDGEIKLPNANGTIALVEDLTAMADALHQDLLDLRLQDVLVAGNETAGRSIAVSEGDGINFEQGVNYARIKAPTALTGVRSLLLPDKSGTVATTDDVAAVAALVDGTMRAPEAYTPSGGLYPATYGGGAIQKGDTFRCGAGTMGAITVNAEDLLIALVDAPGQVDANWQTIESNRTVATQAQAEDIASTDLNKLMPPQRWWQAWTKGLTLTAFAAAVRNMVLTGYTVGANAAVAATDSIMTAIRKLQGQINATNTAVSGKLDKASNLSDVANAPTARTNLGLGALATKDDLRELKEDSAGLEGADNPYGRKLLCMDMVSPTVWRRADPANGGRVLAIALNCSGGSTPVAGTLLYAGRTTKYFDQGSPSLQPFTQYYLDPAEPGNVTTTPNAWPAFFSGAPGPGGVEIIFTPQNKSSAVSANGEMIISNGGFALVDKTVSHGGTDIAGSIMDMVPLGPGVYQVKAHLWVTMADLLHSGVDGNLSVKVLMAPSPTSNYSSFTVSLETQSAGFDMVTRSLSDLNTWMDLPDQKCEIPCLLAIDGIISFPDSGTRSLKVYLAVNDDTGYSAELGDRSIIAWNKIKNG